MEKFEFKSGEGLSLFWDNALGEPVPHHCTVSDTEETGIWVVFDDEPGIEGFWSFEDVKLFMRDGGKKFEGVKAMSVDEDTANKYLKE